MLFNISNLWTQGMWSLLQTQIRCIQYKIAMKPDEEKGVKNEAGWMGCGEREGEREFIGKIKRAKRVGCVTNESWME